MKFPQVDVINEWNVIGWMPVDGVYNSFEGHFIQYFVCRVDDFLAVVLSSSVLQRHGSVNEIVLHVDNNKHRYWCNNLEKIIKLINSSSFADYFKELI